MRFWSSLFKSKSSSGSLTTRTNNDGRIKTDVITNTGNKTSDGKPKHEHTSVKVNPKTGYNQQYWGGENSQDRGYNKKKPE